MKLFSAKKLPMLVLMIVLGLLSSPLGVTRAHAAGVLYVMPGGTGDCSSWANACELQTALAAATSGDEIWVAAGVYKPTANPTDRSATFQLKGGVAIYGGFVGTETERDQRNFEVNATILSGDIDNNDSQTPVITDISTVRGMNTNSSHVVVGISDAILDGFTITAGNGYEGGGVYNNAISPVFENLHVQGNAASYGGGMYNQASSPQLTNVTFEGNSAYQRGGGMYNISSSNPILMDVAFNANLSSEYGGGMYTDHSSPIIENTTFSNNSALYGGGMYNINSSPMLTNVTFSGNSAGGSGGGMGNLSNSSPILTNVTFSGNSAGSYGGGMNVYSGSTPQIRNVIFWGNTASYESQIGNIARIPLNISDSVIQGGCPAGSTCTNILTDDPLFGQMGNYGGLTRTVPLLPGSSAIDAGNADICPATDQRGIIRPYGAGCDIGAYEYDETIVLDTSLDDHPDSLSYTAEAGFSFSGSSNMNEQVNFECALDGTDFAACSSPLVYSDLANGTHIFMVRATDALGNLDETPAAYAWTISVNDAILYIKPDISGTGDCSSWENACLLQSALVNALGGNEIWVAAGIYRPTTDITDRTATFRLKNGVVVYGGFSGLETNREQRNPMINLTILSGDLYGDDDGFTNNDENSYHVVTGVTGATLDGFVITAGNASNNSSGGGIYNNGSSPVLTNIIVRDNAATFGGGMSNTNNSHPILTNVAFIGNSAMSNRGGGGMYNYSSNPYLTNVTFSDNSAGLGGGIYNVQSSPTLINVTLYANAATATCGGGAYNESSSPQIQNTIFWGNHSTSGGVQICNTGANSQPAIRDSVVQGGYAGGTNIIIADPLLGVLGNYDSFTPTVPVMPGSSAIDTASDVVCPSVDQRGISRPQGAHCDIGAYEYTDVIALDTKIDSYPPNPNPVDESIFTFSGLANTGSSTLLECSLDGSPFESCTSPMTYTGLSSGSHNFAVRSKDMHGHLDTTPASYSWTVRLYIAGVQYVKPNAVGNGDCSGWENACDLQTALLGAVSGGEIWVASGTYKPTMKFIDRVATFQLKDGVAVYGGFSGTETTREQRNFETNQTILSGDIDNNDSQTPIITNIKTVTGNTTNSYHVVTGATGATLDGFTITAGYGYLKSGGGIYNNTASSPILSNLTFQGNWAYYGGGGMYNGANSNPTLTNSTFKNNFAGSGGGMANSGGRSLLTNVTFSGNFSHNGGGMYNEANGNPTLINVTFSGNSADDNGGGIYNYGGKPVLKDVTFSGNSANLGGGIHNFGSPMLNNVTFSNNLTTGLDGKGGGIFNKAGNPQIYNTLFWGNTGVQIYTEAGTPLVSNSVIQGGCPVGSSCTNIIVTDPLLGSLDNHGGFTQVIPLGEGSSAIDAGNDIYCPAHDQRGLFRPQAARCDIGAYEYDDPELDTRIDSFPVAQSQIDTAVFTFSSSDISAEFECSLDGSGFTACANPETYAGLLDGSHIFVVRAKDALGNMDNTPPSYTWSVRTAPLYAKPSATGTGDCVSWANACTLQTALAKALNDDEIWVTGGVYKPTTDPTDRAATFQLGHGIAIYGGFSGTESLLDQRNPVLNPTILSGDIDNNDSQTPVITNINTVTGNATNSFHVVTIVGDAILDGFTITAGYAIVNAGQMGQGGGVYIENGSMTLKNIVFQGNLAWQGGGLYNRLGNLNLVNSAFIGNLADRSGMGGGAYSVSQESIITNVTFSRNFAYVGAGMVDFSGGSILTNSTFSENSATSEAGGINATNYTQIRNSIFWKNTADAYAPSAQIQGSPIIHDSVVQDGYRGFGEATNIYTADPRLGELGNYGGFTPTIPLLTGSSAIELGDETFCPDNDQRGVARPQNAYCDIGAYEYDLPICPKIYHAKPVASGSGNCSSWANACTLQTALLNAIAGDEIWVAAGTHKPTTNSSDRAATFNLKGRVAVYGGFIGVETSRNQRNPAVNLTILSGEIGSLGKNDNSYHVVTNAGKAILDGFTIMGGNANSTYAPNDRGGGIYSQNCSSTLTGLIITGNSAFERGGGMYNGGGDTILMQVVFSDNSSTYGGGVYSYQGDLVLSDVVFSGNSSSYGAGMYNSVSNSELKNVIFRENSTGGQGGGMLNESSTPTLINVSFENNSAMMSGGGIYNRQSNPVITNTTFSNNFAHYGGGIANSYSHALITNVTFHKNLAQYSGGGIYNSNSNPVLINVTLSENSAVISGGGLYNESSNAQIQNSIFWNNVAPSGAQIHNQAASIPSVSFSVVQGGYVGGTNIITTDPMLGALGDYGGFTRVIPLLAGSSAIDVGNDTVCPNDDQRGVTRPQEAGCDIGAFEYIVPPGAFEKLGPIEAETGVSLSPTLSWQPSSGATSYEYCYSSAPGPCTKWNSVGTDTSVALSGLAPNYTYYWQVRSVNAGGAAEADTGNWWSFSTTADPVNTWPPYSPPEPASFGDTPATHWAWGWIERLYSAGITGGCGGSNYCPEEPVTRAQMAIFLLRGVHGSSYTPPLVGDSSGFSDVPVSYWASAWIKQFYAKGITGGCGSGVYCPDQSVTRAQMAIFLLRAKHGSSYSPPAVAVDGGMGFGDVAADYWAAAWIKQLAAEGITGGCGNGNYCPEEPVTRAQMAIFLVRAFGLP